MRRRKFRLVKVIKAKVRGGGGGGGGGRRNVLDAMAHIRSS